jgi:hypothetical protein
MVKTTLSSNLDRCKKRHHFDRRQAETSGPAAALDGVGRREEEGAYERALYGGSEALDIVCSAINTRRRHDWIESASP